MNPVLSIIVPCYNGEKYLRRAVESILCQPEASQIDMLIINDGSTDNSGMICDELAGKYENVRTIHKENGGVSSARNLGIEKARGKYIGFLDCDDWWEPGVFDSRLAEELRSPDSAEVYQFSFREVNHDVSLEYLHLLEDKEHSYETPGFGRYDWSPHCAFFHLRTLLLEKEVRYLMCKVGEDGAMVEMSLYHARSLKQLSTVLFTYWENYDSCVHTTDPLLAIREQCKGIEQRKAYFEKFDVAVDEETEKVWQILNSLPKICAAKPYNVVHPFMEEQCMNILAKRPDIQFGDLMWSRVVAWRANSYRYWVMQKIKVALPLGIKNMMMNFPVVGKWVNYAYMRSHRKFTPIEK